MVILKRTRSSPRCQLCNAIQMRPEIIRNGSSGKRRRTANDLSKNNQRWLSACDQSKKWDALDHELLVQIFSRVPSEDVLVNVFWVCPSWKSACFAALFWSRHNVLDLTALDAVAAFYRSKNFHASRSSGRAWKFDLMKLLGHILTDDSTVHLYNLSAWRHSIWTVIFPERVKIQDKHLIFVAKRTPSVQRVLLRNCWRLRYGLEEAGPLWKYIKELHILNPGVSGYISAVASSCKRLEILNVGQPVLVIRKKTARLVSCLPELKKLTFAQARVYPCGIVHFFEICSPELEVCFKDCALMKRNYPLFASSGPAVFERDTDFMTRSFTLRWTRDNQGHLSWHVRPMTASCLSTFDDGDDNSNNALVALCNVNNSVDCVSTVYAAASPNVLR